MAHNSARDLHDARRINVDDEHKAMRLNRSDDMDRLVGTARFERGRYGLIATNFRHGRLPAGQPRERDNRAFGSLSDLDAALNGHSIPLLTGSMTSAARQESVA